ARPLQLLDAADQVDGAAVAAADRRHRPLGGPARRAELHPYRRTGASGLALAVLPRAVGLLHPADVLLRKGVRGAHALGRSRHPGGGPLMDLLDPLLTDLQLLAKPSLFNVYFAVASIPAGFLFAILMALGKASPNPLLARLCRGYIYAFRGSLFFLQLFMFYSMALAFSVSLWKPVGIVWLILQPLFLGPVTLTLNTTAYTAEIFHGALQAVPRGEIEAGRAYGMSRWQQFRSVTWPHLIRIAWPAYTNEVVFLFHATALIDRK